MVKNLPKQIRSTDRRNLEFKRFVSTENDFDAALEEIEEEVT